MTHGKSATTDENAGGHVCQLKAFGCHSPSSSVSKYSFSFGFRNISCDHGEWGC